MDNIFMNTMVNMNWTQIQRAAESNTPVLLPLGVIEEHGPHLCLGTDIYIAHLQCLAVQRAMAGRGYASVIAPPFYWGICQANAGFIGSFRVRKETMKALLLDLLASLDEFGFRRVYGINAHGDIEHNVAILEAFREANEKLPIRACYGFARERLVPYGLTGEEPFLFVVDPAGSTVSTSSIPDVHGGDIETAVVHHYSPDLVDTECAKTLPSVPLAPDKGMEWLLGGHTKELSPQGYLGAPAEYEGVDVQAYLKDTAERICAGIMGRL